MTSGQESAAPSVGLGTHSARGLVYFFAGSSAAKLINVGAQVLLTRLLSPGAFGVVALAYTITVFIQVIEQAGVGDLLIQRRHFRRWAIPGFWLALALGTLSFLLILLAAPLAAAYNKNDQLFWVLVVLAPASIPNSLTVVPRAQLARQLRFRALATINVVTLTLRMVLAVVFAAIIKQSGQTQLEPFAFVAPTPIVSTLTAAFLWWWVRPPWSPHLRLRRWRHLIGDSTMLLVAEFQRAILDQSDYIALGLFHRAADLIGLYYFGYTFSIQMLQLFAFNLMNVLFPALTRLNDRPHVQFQGFLKAQRILAMLGISSCFLQAAVAEPVTRLLLDPRWLGSIIVMQILSLGMATRMVAGASYVLLKSQGRFKAALWNRWTFVTLQVVLLFVVLALGGGITEVAIVVGGVSTIYGPATFYTAIRPYGAGWREVAEVMLPPIISSGSAVGAAWMIAQAMGRLGYGYWPQLIETTMVAVVLGVLFARTWMRPVWDDLWARIWRMLPARTAVQ